MNTHYFTMKENNMGEVKIKIMTSYNNLIILVYSFRFPAIHNILFGGWGTYRMVFERKKKRNSCCYARM
jgi:hypothetical protein